MITVKGPTNFATTVSSTPALPAGWQVGDLLLIVIESTGGQVYTPPAGWSAVNGSPVVNSNITQLDVFFKVAVEGEPNPAITDSGDHMVGAVFAVSGVDTTSTVGFVDTSAPAASTTAVDFPAISGANIGEGDYVFFFLASHLSSAAYASKTITNVEVSIEGGYGSTQGNDGTLLWIGGRAIDASGVDMAATLSSARYQALMTISLFAAPDTDAVVQGSQLSTVTTLYQNDALTASAQMNTVAVEYRDDLLLTGIQMITVVTVEEAKRSNNFMNFNPT